jgi:amino acid transporter
MVVNGTDHEVSRPDERPLFDRDGPKYPYRSRGQIFRAYYALSGFTLFSIFNGWQVLSEYHYSGTFLTTDFIGCYLGVRGSTTK